MADHSDPPREAAGAVEKITDAILEFVGQIPDPKEEPSQEPAKLARALSKSAAMKAALAAGSLALPPGPLGWLTILPELVVVWKIQAQMVADIAALHGKTAALTREQMLYCLFRHLAAQAVRDLVVRVGERFLVRRATLQVLRGAAKAVGVRVTQRALGRGVSRWLPIVGAVGVGAYVYFDTAEVAATAIELFEREVEVEPAPPADGPVKPGSPNGTA